MKTKFIVIIVAIVLLVTVGSGIYRFIKGAYSSCGDYSFIEPPCEQLPSISEVKRVLDANRIEVNKLKKISPNVFLSVREPCQGKGLIIISHPSEDECASIRKVLSNNKFLGLPYKIINQ
jgi:hypothetical protein